MPPGHIDKTPLNNPVQYRFPLDCRAMHRPMIQSTRKLRFKPGISFFEHLYRIYSPESGVAPFQRFQSRSASICVGDHARLDRPNGVWLHL